MQYTQPDGPNNRTNLGPPQDVQKGMRLLPGAWPMLSEEAPQQLGTDSTVGAGRQGGIKKKQFHHTVGTAAQFLAEAELRDWEETDVECHLATGQRGMRIDCGTHTPGLCQEDDLLRNP